MPIKAKDLRLYLVMGSQDCLGRDPVAVLQAAISGGITCFQFREKHSARNLRETVELGHSLRALCRTHRIPFLVNDRVDLALILDADGVHLGQDDLPVPEAKRILPPSCVIGVSARSIPEARQAQQEGADYIGIGPMFATTSKPDAKQPIGPEALAEIRQALGDFPIVGIGGITVDNMAAVRQAGADGIAVISAITRADSPEQAAQQLRQCSR
jgi:thiamine-phosphate pyrophosphorylase